MSRILWFQRQNDAPFQFLCDDGIHIPRLAEKLNLNANTVELNGVGVDFNPTGYLTSTAFLTGRGYGNTRAKPIKVTGRPSAAAAERTGAWSYVKQHWEPMALVSALVLTLVGLLIGEYRLHGLIAAPINQWYNFIGVATITGVAKDCCKVEPPYKLLVYLIRAVYFIFRKIAVFLRLEDNAVLVVAIFGGVLATFVPAAIVLWLKLKGY